MDFALVAADQNCEPKAAITATWQAAQFPSHCDRRSRGGTRNARRFAKFRSVVRAGTGLIVVAPSTPADAKGLLKSAIRAGNPVMFIEHSCFISRAARCPRMIRSFLSDKAAVKREGHDVTIVALFADVVAGIGSGGELEKAGIDAEVIDLRTIEPLDMDTIITSVRKTGRLLAVHEAHANCGIGAEIVARIYEQAPEALITPARRLAQNMRLFPSPSRSKMSSCRK